MVVLGVFRRRHLQHAESGPQHQGDLRRLRWPVGVRDGHRSLPRHPRVREGRGDRGLRGGQVDRQLHHPRPSDHPRLHGLPPAGDDRRAVQQHRGDRSAGPQPVEPRKLREGRPVPRHGRLRSAIRTATSSSTARTRGSPAPSLRSPPAKFNYDDRRVQELLHDRRRGRQHRQRLHRLPRRPRQHVAGETADPRGVHRVPCRVDACRHHDRTRAASGRRSRTWRPIRSKPA